MRNGRFEIGRWLFRSSGSKPGFFRIGETEAVLRQGETVPEDRDKFTMSTMMGQMVGRAALTKAVGRGRESRLMSWPL